MRRPVERRAAADSFAQQGFQRAHELYAWPCVARQYLDFFEQSLRHRAAALNTHS